MRYPVYDPLENAKHRGSLDDNDQEELDSGVDYRRILKG
jgi:hypothetical protein